MSTEALVDLLIEVEGDASDVYPLLPDMAEWANTCCEKIRDALMANDTAAAALAGVELGRGLPEFQRIAKRARTASFTSDLEGRASQKADERRKRYYVERGRGYSDAEACKRAAAALGVDPKTIRRALKSINPE